MLALPTVKSDLKAFLLGLTIGLTVSFILNNILYQQVLQLSELSKRTVDIEIIRYISETKSQTRGAPNSDQKGIIVSTPADQKCENKTIFPFTNPAAYSVDDTIPRFLCENVRVLCLLVAREENLLEKTIHMNNTWGRRCNKLLIFTLKANKKFRTIGLNITDVYPSHTEEVMAAYRYVYKHHMEDADWFLEASDDAYVIMENLRYFLSSQNPHKSACFGCYSVTSLGEREAIDGVGSYVISKEALIRVVQKSSSLVACVHNGGQENLSMPQCMERLGVKLEDSSDNLGRTRFNCHRPGDLLLQNPQVDTRKIIQGISNYAVSIRNVDKEFMQELELFLYQIRPFGVPFETIDINKWNS